MTMIVSNSKQELWPCCGAAFFFVTDTVASSNLVVECCGVCLFAGQPYSKQDSLQVK